MNGRNFLLNNGSKPKKHGFYQNIIIEAESPQKAVLLARARIMHNKELRAITLNKKGDPPYVELRSFWELDILDDVSNIDLERRFYSEKRWWQFWKRTHIEKDTASV